MKKLITLLLFIPAIITFSQSQNRYLNLGVSELKAGNLESSILYFDTLISKEPQNIDAYFMRGFAKGQQKKYDEAISDFDKVILIDPNHSTAYDNRGLCKKNKGDYSGAILDYTKAIELEPNNPKAYHNRAVAKYYFTMDTVGACYDWRTSANLGYQKGDHYFVKNCYNRKDIKTRYKETEDVKKRRKQYFAQSMTEEEFRKLTNDLNILFTIPDGFKTTKVIPNSNMPYFFALKHKAADFEIRFFIESFTDMKKQIDESGVEIDKNWFNKSYEGSYISSLSNISQGIIPIYYHYKASDVSIEFNADDGIYSNFFPDSEYAENYKYCLFMVLHKNNHSNIYVSFLSNDLDNFNKYLIAGFYSLKFKE